MNKLWNQMNWIKITEKMPDGLGPHGWVLVYIPAYQEVMPSWYNKKQNKFTFPSGDMEDEIDINRISHWMFLPEKPK